MSKFSIKPNYLKCCAAPLLSVFLYSFGKSDDYLQSFFFDNEFVLSQSFGFLFLCVCIGTFGWWIGDIKVESHTVKKIGAGAWIKVDLRELEVLLSSFSKKRIVLKSKGSETITISSWVYPKRDIEKLSNYINTNYRRTK